MLDSNRVCSRLCFRKNVIVCGFASARTYVTAGCKGISYAGGAGLITRCVCRYSQVAKINTRRRAILSYECRAHGNYAPPLPTCHAGRPGKPREAQRNIAHYSGLRLLWTWRTCPLHCRLPGSKALEYQSEAPGNKNERAC